MVFGHSSSMWSTDMLAIVVNKNLWHSEKETFEDLILYLVKEIWGKIEKMGEIIGEKIIFLVVWLGEKRGWKLVGLKYFLYPPKIQSPQIGEKCERENGNRKVTKLSDKTIPMQTTFFFLLSPFVFFLLIYIHFLKMTDWCLEEL